MGGRIAGLMTGQCNDGSEADRREGAQYLKEFAPAMIGYIVSLTAVMFLVDFDTDSLRNYLILLPVIPVAFAALAVYRSVKRIDEYGRMVQVNGMALGFGVAMVGLVAIGLLAVVDLQFAAAPWLVFGASMLTWGLSSRAVMGRDA